MDVCHLARLRSNWAFWCRHFFMDIQGTYKKLGGLLVLGSALSRAKTGAPRVWPRARGPQVVSVGARHESCK